jgi:hypothetical protein
MTLDDSHQVTCRVKNSDAVSKPRVCRSGIDQFRESKLFDAAEALKGPTLDNPPEYVLELICAELD